MKWTRVSDRALTSDEPPGYTISRSPAHGFVRPGQKITYMLTHSGRILHVERGVEDTHDATLVATNIMRRKALEHAGA